MPRLIFYIATYNYKLGVKFQYAICNFPVGGLTIGTWHLPR